MATILSLAEKCTSGMHLTDRQQTMVVEKITLAWLIEQIDANTNRLYTIVAPPKNIDAAARISGSDPGFDISDAIHGFDARKFYVSANPSGERLVGFPRDGKSLYDSEHGMRCIVKTMFDDFSGLRLEPRLKTKAYKFLKAHK